MEDNIVFVRPKYYTQVNVKKNPEETNYQNIDIKFGELDQYEVVSQIGRGKYSEVFEGYNQQIKKSCVIKVLRPIRQKKIKRQIKILQDLVKVPNVIRLLDIVKDDFTKSTSLILEHFKADEHRILFPQLTDYDVRFYLFEILRTLDLVHSHGIIHRDIQPHNILFNHEKKQIRIIDWGLAEYYFPKQQLNVKVASRFFKSPELLVDYQFYDFSLDIWSLGCIFAGMIFIKDPFFHGNNNLDQLEKICRVLGTNELFDFLEKYKIKLHPGFEGVLGKHPKKLLSKFITSENQHLANLEAVDLLSQMLVYDPEERITAQDALTHDYFMPVREAINKENQLRESQANKENVSQAGGKDDKSEKKKK